MQWDADDNIVTPYQNGNGVSHGTTYIDITQLGAAVRDYVQFGVQVKNGSNGSVQLCNATLRVTPKEK